MKKPHGMETDTFLAMHNPEALESKIEHSLRTSKKLFQTFPQWSDEQIADLSGAPLKVVKAMRQELENGQNGNLKKPLTPHEKLVQEAKIREKVILAEKLIEQFPDWGNAQIADLTELSWEVVGTIRSQLADYLYEEEIAEDDTNADLIK